MVAAQIRPNRFKNREGKGRARGFIRAMKDEDLDQLLNTWHCSPEPEARLGSRVWQRISEREESGWFREGLRDFFGARPVAAPLVTAALTMAAVVGGITAAEMRVQSAREYASTTDLEQVYFESINPVAMARSGHYHR